MLGNLFIKKGLTRIITKSVAKGITLIKKDFDMALVKYDVS